MSVPAGSIPPAAVFPQGSCCCCPPPPQDLEPQSTAGIDIAMVEALHKLAQSSKIAEAQVGPMLLLCRCHTPTLAAGPGA
jgi:hypothetical protein